MIRSDPPILPMEPVVWNALGYQFEAAPMLAALSACMIVRIWVCLNAAPISVRARGLNISVTAISLLFTGGWILLQRPSPFFALLTGSGFGALGSGIIAVSLNWVRRLEPFDQDPDARHGDDMSPSAHAEITSTMTRSQEPLSK